jgi:heterodisulfide reductase subunit A-like polyferredoxin
VQCLLDYDIQLQLQHTVNRIIGGDRVEAIEAVQVDEKWNPIPGSEEIIPCDTLLLSVGLIPENELSRKAGVKLDTLTAGPVVDDRFETNVAGVFAAGNVVHVYDLVDWVSEAGLAAGKAAAQYAVSKEARSFERIPVIAGENVHHVVPHQICKQSLAEEPIKLQLRVKQPVEEPVWVEVRKGDSLVARKAERYARPGEMITVTLPLKAYDDVLSASELTVAVVKR